VLPIPPGMRWIDAKPVILPGMGNDAPKELPMTKPKKPEAISTIKPASILSGGLRFGMPKAPEATAKPKREKKSTQKNDPRLVAAARELRDRWLERVNAGLERIETSAKYHVTCASPEKKPVALLTAA
jgi:hypothetical protein